MTFEPLHFTVLGYAARIARPEAALLLPVVLVAAAVAAFGLHARHRAAGRVVQAERLFPKVLPGASLGRSAAGTSLGLLGLLCLVFALAGPQCGERAALLKRYGSDVVVAVDASRSMLARDLPPSRLARSKLELSALIDRLAGDRVGVVVFAGEAFVQCPLTTDYGAAKLFLRAIDPEAMPVQGTALAEALGTASDMLRDADRGAKGRAVLLLSDGEDHEGDVEGAIERLKAEGIRVFSVGLGSTEGTPIPMLDRDGNVTGYRKDAEGRTVVTRLEDGQLRRIAAETGGRYFAGTGGDIGMGEVLAELERLEKEEFESRLSVEYEDVYEYAALPAFLLLVLGAAWRERRSA